MFFLTIQTDNAAFCAEDEQDNDANARGSEVARILRRLADQVERDGLEDGDTFKLADANGNKVGQATT